MSESEWVSLREAAAMLGVHPATVRNWADKGELPARRTPGGHRRFRRTDLLRQAERQTEVQPLEVQVIIQNALGQARMSVSGEGGLPSEPWYTLMGEAARAEMRTMGRTVLESLREYLAAGATDAGLARAITLGRDYAAVLARDGLTLPEAVRGMLFFSDFVINAILTWSEITPPRSAPEWASLLRQVNTFIHAMLLSIIEFYEEE